MMRAPGRTVAARTELRYLPSKSDPLQSAKVGTPDVTLPPFLPGTLCYGAMPAMTTSSQVEKSISSKESAMHESPVPGLPGPSRCPRRCRHRRSWRLPSTTEEGIVALPLEEVVLARAAIQGVCPGQFRPSDHALYIMPPTRHT